MNKTIDLKCSEKEFKEVSSGENLQNATFYETIIKKI